MWTFRWLLRWDSADPDDRLDLGQHFHGCGRHISNVSIAADLSCPTARTCDHHRRKARIASPGSAAGTRAFLSTASVGLGTATTARDQPTTPAAQMSWR